MKLVEKYLNPKPKPVTQVSRLKQEGLHANLLKEIRNKSALWLQKCSMVKM